ncbi:nck-associated protein 5 [Cricetulus griseus]|nr:nck-associated protein 5 [Cricetulus griseus]
MMNTRSREGAAGNYLRYFIDQTIILLGMEETVRSLLQSQGSPEHKREEPSKITAYEERVSEEERKHQEALADLQVVVDEDSRSENSSTDEGKENTRLLLKRLKALEVKNVVVK